MNKRQPNLSPNECHNYTSTKLEVLARSYLETVQHIRHSTNYCQYISTIVMPKILSAILKLLRSMWMRQKLTQNQLVDAASKKVKTLSPSVAVSCHRPAPLTGFFVLQNEQVLPVFYLCVYFCFYIIIYSTYNTQ